MIISFDLNSCRLEEFHRSKMFQSFKVITLKGVLIGSFDFSDFRRAGPLDSQAVGRERCETWGSGCIAELHYNFCT